MEPAPIRNIVPHKRIPRRKKEASNIFPSIAEFELSAIFSHYRRPLARRNIIPSSQKLKGNSSLNRRLRIDIPSLIPRSNEANFFFFFPSPVSRRKEERRKNTRARHGLLYTRGGCTNKLDEPWLSLAARTSNETLVFCIGEDLKRVMATTYVRPSRSSQRKRGADRWKNEFENSELSSKFPRNFITRVTARIRDF